MSGEDAAVYPRKVTVRVGLWCGIAEMSRYFGLSRTMLKGME